MNDFGNKIKELRKRKGLTQAELGKLLGFSSVTVTKYENGKISSPKVSTIQKLAEIFGVKPSYLTGLYHDEEVDLRLNGCDYIKLPSVEARVKGRVAAHRLEEFEDIIEDPVSYLKADHCLLIEDDSMINAGINKGDLLFYQETKQAEDGEIAIVLIDDTIHIKRYWVAENGMILTPDNSKLKPTYYPSRKGIIILGKPTHVVKKLK